MSRIAVALATLGMVTLGALPVAAAETTCASASCTWRLEADSLLEGVSWRPIVAEIEPATKRSSGLTLEIDGASRAGTFALVSERVSVPKAGSFSVTLRSTGELGRFAFIIREEGYPGWRETPEAADTVLFHEPRTEWSHASWAWERRNPESTHVRVFLRGEVREGASAGIEFRTPYFGADTTRWFLDGEARPFAFGPHARRDFETPGQHVVRAERPSGTETFDVDVPVLPPAPAFRVSTSPVVLGGVRLDASASTSPFHPNLARNGDFSAGRTAWALAPHELGAEAQTSVEEGRLGITIPSPSSDASAWVRQTVRVQPGVPHEFSWRGWDDGGVLYFGVKVWEPSGVQHLVSAPAGGSHETGATAVFVPGSDTVEIQLRALFMTGVSGTAWFDDIVLRRALDYRWSIGDHAVAASGGGMRADLALPPSRASEVRLTVTDAHGGRASTSSATSVHGADLAIRLRDEPVAVLVGSEIVLDAAPTSVPAFDVLGGPGAWPLWAVEDIEAPGRARAHVRDGVASVGIGDEPETVGVGLHRHLVLPVGAGESLLAFRYRVAGDVVEVRAVARFHADGVVASETRAKFPPSTDWRTATMRVPAPPQEYENVLLNLRGVVAGGGSGRVEFANVTLGPAFEPLWTIGREALSDPVANVEVHVVGGVPWELMVRTPEGLSASRSGRVAVVDAPVLYPSLAGGVVARWKAEQFPQDVRVRLEGATAAEVDASAGAVALGEFAAGSYAVVAVSPGGHRAPLASASFVDRAGLVASEATFASATRAQPMRLALPLPNPDLVVATLHLRGPLGREVQVALAPEAEGGRWSASWTPSPRNPPGTYTVALRLVDSSGATAVVPLEPIRLEITAGDPRGSALLLVALAAAAGVAWARRPDLRAARHRLAPPPGAVALTDGALVVVSFGVAVALRVRDVAHDEHAAGVAAVGTLLAVVTALLTALAGAHTAGGVRAMSERLALAVVGGTAVGVVVVELGRDSAFASIPLSALALYAPLALATLFARRGASSWMARRRVGGARR